jgi:hypothetical protein
MELAHVLRWNDVEIEVQCPYCKGTHKHQYDGPYGVQPQEEPQEEPQEGPQEEPQEKIFRCRDHTYKVCFPKHYEINKKDQRIESLELRSVLTTGTDTVQITGKVVAMLERGDPYPVVWALSGYGHDQWRSLISGEVWTNEVKSLCENLMPPHVLPANDWDRVQDIKGWKGRYHASHAEMQLMAYFISKHVFLPGEDLGNRLQGKGWDLLQNPTIIVSSPPCERCEEFRKSMEKKLHVSFCIKGPKFAEKQQQNPVKFGCRVTKKPRAGSGSSGIGRCSGV